MSATHWNLRATFAIWQNNEATMRIMIDTDVLVDVLRNYPPALAWLKR